jgi:ribosomal-protein-alanine N-acetyltransferase
VFAYVRPMQREDTEQVAGIDREAFPSEWPPPNFKSELQNRLAHYLVACDSEKPADESEVKELPMKGFARLTYRVKRLRGLSNLLAKEPSTLREQHIVGFAGFWIMADEAHITTIASRKAYRRQGIGELLLLSIIDRAAKLRARIVTLEVRASNIVAQSLYYKYGFNQVGLRRGYYMDNKEDAIIMSTEDISSAPFKERLEQLKQAYYNKWGTSDYGEES